MRVCDNEITVQKGIKNLLFFASTYTNNFNNFTSIKTQSLISQTNNADVSRFL